MSTITLNTRLVRSDSVFTSQIDDEVVMANLQTDSYYGMDSISSRIWHLLEEPRTVHEVCRLLMGTYNVDEATCQNEVLLFARQLLEAQVVEITAT